MIQTLWATFLLTFPFSIRFLVYEQSSYRFGHFNPWVSGFVYLPEILLVVIGGLYFFSRQSTVDGRQFTKNKWLRWILILFVANGYLITLIKGDSMLGAFWLLRLAEACMAFWLIREEILPKRKVVMLLLFGALLQIAWGALQWQLNHSLGLTWLGESILHPNLKGVSKIDLTDGTKQIRAYGSLLHPNILGAYLAMVFLLVVHFIKKNSWVVWLIIFGVGIYLTQSEAAMIASILGFALYWLYHGYALKKPGEFLATRRNKHLIWLSGLMILLANLFLFFFPRTIQIDHPSWTERQTQIEISRTMLADQPPGVGVGNFTLEMEKYTDRKLPPWEFQPVHNAYFLLLNETGIQGFILFFSFIIYLFYRYWHLKEIILLIGLLVLASFDHLLWTSWVGMILIGLIAGLIRFDIKSN